MQRLYQNLQDSLQCKCKTGQDKDKTKTENNDDITMENILEQETMDEKSD